MAASWYSAMVAASSVSPPPFPSSTAPSDNLMEFAIELGTTLAGADASDIALFTNPTTGLLATASVTFQLTAAVQDVNNSNTSKRYLAGIQQLDVTVPLASFAVLANTCLAPSGFTDCDEAGQSLTLYTYIDLAEHLTVDVASPTRAGYTRKIVSKGIRGTYLSVGGSQTFTLNGAAYETQSAIMSQMSTTTNCFPGSMGGCSASAGSSTPAYTYAAGSFTSTEAQCQGGSFPGTNCTKMYMNTAPNRYLLLLEKVPKMSYDSATGAWSPLTSSSAATVLYFSHAHTIGMHVPNAAACWPYPMCGGNAKVSVDGTSSWTIMLIVALGCIAAVAVFLAVAHYRKHMRSLHAFTGAHRSIPSLTLDGVSLL